MSFLAYPACPKHQRHKLKKRNERKINFNLHTYSSQWHVHTSFCLFTCFPFVQLLSILVVQGREVKRILFAWKLVWWASWETLRWLNCLMPGPLWIVGMPFFFFLSVSNTSLRQRERNREEPAGWFKGQCQMMLLMGPQSSAGVV